MVSMRPRRWSGSGRGPAGKPSTDLRRPCRRRHAVSPETGRDLAEVVGHDLALGEQALDLQGEGEARQLVVAAIGPAQVDVLGQLLCDRRAALAEADVDHVVEESSSEAD